MIAIYTDGSCLKNGSKTSSGGFAIVVVQYKTDPDVDGQVIYTYHKHTDNFTTNNREELKAILYALIHSKLYIGTIDVYSDSAYCVNTLTNWMYNWEKNGWLKSDQQIPENLDIIKEYYDLITNYNYKINLQKIKGHSGHQWNELADKLARKIN